jgi:hypothetical protein
MSQMSDKIRNMQGLTPVKFHPQCIDRLLIHCRIVSGKIREIGDMGIYCPWSELFTFVDKGIRIRFFDWFRLPTPWVFGKNLKAVASPFSGPVKGMYE